MKHIILYPASPRSRHESLVREQFRTIAAEGRKFGLFLILVSQRPDKLDDLVLSECGNKAILHLDSQSMVDKVIKTLGLEGEIVDPTLNNIKHFKKGILLLVGKWVKVTYNIIWCSKENSGGRKEFE